MHKILERLDKQVERDREEKSQHQVVLVNKKERIR